MRPIYIYLKIGLIRGPFKASQFIYWPNCSFKGLSFLRPSRPLKDIKGLWRIIKSFEGQNIWSLKSFKKKPAIKGHSRPTFVLSGRPEGIIYAQHVTKQAWQICPAIFLSIPFFVCWNWCWFAKMLATHIGLYDLGLSGPIFHSILNWRHFFCKSVCLQFNKSKWH